jgi:two-component system, chemotaxis family, sensor kinase CheA
MAMDMEQFHQTFFEESLEGLDLMESALLNLDVGAAEPEAINSIFRAAHSIKGGSGTFGFLDIANFTHLMETLLDEMRDGRRQVVQPEVDLLLRAVDGLRMLVAAAQGAAEVDDDDHGTAGGIAVLHWSRDHALIPVIRPAGTPLPGRAGGSRGLAHTLPPRPGHDAYRQRSAAHPARTGRARRNAGAADSERLPDWALLDPEACYLAWDIELRGEIPRDQVDEVFAWVADEAELEIQPLAAAVQAAGENEPGMVVDGELLVERRRKERRAGSERRGGAGSGETTSIRVSIDKIDDLINMVGELVITQSMLGQIGDDSWAGRLPGQTGKAARWPHGPGTQHPRAAGIGDAHPHAAHQLRLQPLSAPGA